MIRIVFPSVLLTTLALTLPAHATALTRTFVSSAGNDANPCTITQPCATFARAYMLTAPSGIVAALDPGKYGPLTITGSIIINGNGWAALTAPARGAGITISAGANDGIDLKGLEIDGAAAGYIGVDFQSGAALTVANCEIRDFVSDGTGSDATGSGIVIEPSSGTVTFSIVDTTVANNQQGIEYNSAVSTSADVNGTIARVMATANRDGLFIQHDGSGLMRIAISSTVLNNNSDAGIFADASNASEAVTVSMDNLGVTGSPFGILANRDITALLGRSVVTANTIGIANSTNNTFFSYGDNHIDSNATNIGGTNGSTLSRVLVPQ